MKQLQVLGQTSQAELADALAIDPSNLATITADLNDRGLAERTRHEVDRRARAAAEPAGEQLLRRTEGAMGAAEPTSSPRLIQNNASSSTPSYDDSPTASSSAPRPAMTPAQSDALARRSCRVPPGRHGR